MKRIPALAAALALLWCALTALAVYSLIDVRSRQGHVFGTVEWITRADAVHAGLDDVLDALRGLRREADPEARNDAEARIRGRPALDARDLARLTPANQAVFIQGSDAIDATADALARDGSIPDTALGDVREARRALRDDVSRIRVGIAAEAREITDRWLVLLALFVALLAGGGVLLVSFARALRRARVLEELRDDAHAVSDSLRLEIKEFRDAMRALEKSEARYRSVVEMQTDFVMRFQPDGRLRFANAAFGRFWNAAPEDLIGTNVFDLVPMPDRAGAEEYLASFSSRQPVAAREVAVVRPDDGRAWLSWTDRALFDSQGRIVEFQSTGRDVTKRREAEERLRESEQHLRTLAGRLQTAREDERKAIARELHDELGQSLTRLRFEIVLAGKDRLDDGLRGRMGEMLSLVDSTIDGVRRAATRLRPPLLDSMGVAAAIDWQAAGFATQAGLHLRKDIDDQLVAGAEASIALFRVAQEALTNVGRHAQATQVTVRLYRDGDDAVLEVEDDGRGVGMSADPQSSGLIGIRERADALGGSVRIDTPPSGHGTRVTFRVPVAAKEGHR